MRNRHFSKQCLAALSRSAAACALALSISCASTQTSGTAAKPTTKPGSTPKQAAAPDPKKVEDLIAKSEAALAKGQHANARDLVAQALSLDPKNKKAEALLQRIAKAEDSSSTANRKAEVDRLVASADKKLKAADYAGAQADLTKALTFDPKSEAATKLRDRVKEAEARAKSDAVNKDVSKRLAAARDSVKRNNLPEAKRNLEAAKLAANGGEAYKAELASVEKEIRDAEAKIAADKGSREASEAIAQSRDQLKAGKFDLARRSAERALAADKGNKEAMALVEQIAVAEKNAAADAKADAARKELEQSVAAARKLESAGSYDEAIKGYRAVLEKDPNNRDARRGIDSAEKAKSDAAAKLAADAAKAKEAEAKAREVAQATPRPTPAPAAKTPAPAAKTPAPAAKTPAPTPRPTAVPPSSSAAATSTKPGAAKTPAATPKAAAPEETDARERAERIFDEGKELYDQGKLSNARERWREALKEDPTYKKPQAFLDETEKEYNELLAREQATAKFDEAETAAQEKLATLISIRTTEPKPLSDFLADLKLLSGIDFAITGGVEARVEAAFEDKPLREVLDTVLLPIGLKWDRQPGKDIIVITPDLRTQVFPLTPDQLANVDTLIQNGTLGRLLYGPRGTRILDGQEVYADGRQNVVVITDSPRNIEKFGQFLDTLKSAAPQTLIFKSYSIQGNKAPQIKSLLAAILSVDDNAPYNPERRLIVDGNTLIIKDTAENIGKAEQLLTDKNFLREFYSDRLSVATFNLTPVIEFDENPDLARSFGEQVRTVVETLLYSQEGRSKAEREGRRLWWDPATLQLTVTDYPDNLAAVQRFIEGLPQIQTKRRNKIFFLDWAIAGDLSGQIQQFLGQAATTDDSGAGGDTITRSVGREDEFRFREAFFRVTRIDENDAADDNDDEIEFVVRTGTTSQDVRIREFRSQFVEDFEIVADDITPSSTPGEGRARVTIRFVQGGSGGAQQETSTPTPASSEGGDEEEGVNIVPIENLNALFVEYDTAEQLQEIEFWIQQLDIPTLQVNMEVRFVEVFEQRARELKSDFLITDITEGFDFSGAVVGTRFGRDQDEVRSPFEPLPEDAFRSNLPNGGVSIGMRLLNGGAPIDLNLKALEAAGVINITNAPSVTALNGEDVSFEITREIRTATTNTNTTGGGTDSGNNNNGLSIGIVESPVRLDITPTVTQAGNIDIELDAEIIDNESRRGIAFTSVPTTQVPTLPNGVATTDLQSYLVLRKNLDTRARIRDGGTLVLGGWISSRSEDMTSGVPVLRDIPWLGRLLFSREIKHDEKVTLNIFLSGEVLRD